jgi:hypothetical protein
VGCPWVIRAFYLWSSRTTLGESPAEDKVSSNPGANTRRYEGKTIKTRTLVDGQGMGDEMGETGRKNNLSPEGRAAMSAAGVASMAAWDRAEMRRSKEAANQEAVDRAEALINKTIAELGGEDKLTARQASLIESQRTALIVLCLAQTRLKRKGVLTRGNRPDPLLATITSYMNMVRLNLRVLGLKDADDERSAADQAALDSLLDYTKKDGDDGETESNRDVAIPE